MTPLEAVIRETLQEILSRRQDVLQIALPLRAKFEHWLKWELAAALKKRNFQDVKVEEQFGPTHERSDVSATYQSQRIHIELKTANTNWRAEGLANKNRPITKNIDGIIHDIKKARQAGLNQLGIIGFVLFPVPVRLWQTERSQMREHFQRIEQEGGLRHGEIEAATEYLSCVSDYGLTLTTLAISNAKRPIL